MCTVYLKPVTAPHLFELYIEKQDRRSHDKTSLANSHTNIG